MRLFYALIPSEETIDALLPIMHGVSGARWQSRRQLHLTLRFIGDVSGHLVDELANALQERIEAVPPVTLSGVGYFEKNGAPNALWVKAAPRDPLALLHRKLDRACQAAGLEPEHRTFMPHVTVARLSRSAGPIQGWIADNAGFDAGSVRFARCALVESVPADNGRHYEELAWVELD